MKIAQHLKQMLEQGVAGNQSQLVSRLKEKGIQTTQSTVSRALKKINAVRQMDENGNFIYSFSVRPSVDESAVSFRRLVRKLKDNSQMIVVHTDPGTAGTVAKFIDDHDFETVLGTVAGDDTILIVPSDVTKTKETSLGIERFLKQIGLL